MSHESPSPTDGEETIFPKPEHLSPAVQASLRRYWRSNVQIMGVLLAVWAVAGLGCGVLFADVLNGLARLGGYPLGFWFAQQASIIVFVLLILCYAVALNRLDAKHHAEIEALRNGEEGSE